MFGWSKKNNSKKNPKRRGGSGGPILNEFGLPVAQTGGGGNDEELEAELRALTGGVISLEDDLEINDDGSDVEAEFMRMIGETKSKKKKSKKAEVPERENGLEPDLDFDLKDMNEEDEDIDVDENDPELLGELMGLTEGDDEEDEEEEEEEQEEKEEEKKEVTVTSMLKERLNMYKEAEAKAKENKESSRARRFGRGIKTLQQLIKKAEAGQPVLPSEIPPVIATNLKPAPPLPPFPPQSTQPFEPSSSSSPVQPVREHEADVPAEEMNNLSIDARPSTIEEAFSATVKEEPVPEPEPEPESEIINEPVPIVENGLLSILKSRRDEYKASALAAKRNNDIETALKHVKYVKELNGLIDAVERGEEIEEFDIPPSLNEPPRQNKIEKMTPLKFEAPEEFEEYEIPRTTSEALDQRLRIYEGFKIECQRKGDERGVEKNSKIIQIYSEAIKLHKAGKKIPLLKLPTPPGCPPIPIPFEID